MKFHFCSIVFLALFIFPGCDSRKEEPQVLEKTPSIQEQQTPALNIEHATLLQEPINTFLVETATEALPFWRENATTKPALVLFSNEPFLTPVPEDLRVQSSNLIRNGSSEQIKARAVDITPNPLLLHSMAIDAAFKAGLFSELVWILPSKEETSLPPLAAFRQKLVDAALISRTEAETLSEQGGAFSGSFRDIPVTIGNLSAIPLPKNPAWVHFDLSFFKPLYKNEVSTPLYSVTFEALGKIRKAGLSSIGTSVSHSNLGGELSLKIRFLGQEIAHLVRNPESLDAGLPELQARRAQNLYLKEFMKKDDILKNCLAMEKLAPKDASVKFDLYNVYRTHKQGDLALEALEQAVALDPVYALEYLNLAGTAIEAQRPEASLQMLNKARAVFPDDPLILLQLASLRIMSGQREAAMTLVRELRQLPWSKIYDQDMPDQLARLEEAAQSLPASSGQ